MRRNFNKGFCLLVGTLSYVMVVTGCGSGGSYKSAESYAPESSYATEEAAGAGLYDQAYDDYEVAEASEERDSSGAEEITEEKSTNTKRKLITNMSMHAETKEFDKTLDFVKTRTEELGGYVESFSSDKSSYNDERSANLTLRIPEEKLDSFVDEVSKNSNITSQDMDVTDVTLTYADLESHRNALRAEEDQLLSLMEKAETIEDIMLIQDKLTDVRYQLESMESQLRTYDNQITYSTLRLYLREVIEYTPEPVKNPTFGERAREGFTDNLAAVITFFTELALLLITHIPVLIILLIIIVIIVLFIRAAEKKRKERLASMPPMQRPVIPQGPSTYGPYNGPAQPMGGPVGPMNGPDIPINGPVPPMNGPAAPVNGSSEPVNGSDAPVNNSENNDSNNTTDNK